MRRVCRSTARQSQTLRVLHPTNVHNSSSSSTRGRLGLGRNGELASAFFCQLGHRHARDAGGAHDAALRVTLKPELFDLRILRRFARGGGLKHRLMAATRAPILGFALAVAVFAEGGTTAFGLG